jgi:two-component system sensor histidine kinase/response regulator
MTEHDDLVIVEDSRTQAEHMRQVLADAGFRVRVATSGEGALALCRDKVPSVLLSDLMMPDMDGLALVRALRLDPELADLPVILLTAHHEPEHVVNAMRAGADNYVAKPFDPQVLVERVRSTLTLYRARRDPTPVPLRAGLFAVLRSALADAAQRAAELERSRASLAEAVQMRDELMALVAHDLRSPLQVMLGYANLAARDPTGPAGLRLPGAVTQQVSTMVRLIDDLVDLSQIEQGKLRMELEQVDLVTLLRNCVTALQQHGECSKHPLQLEAPASVPHTVDPRRVAQIVTNLVSNACKYSDPGQRVDILLEEQPDAVRLRVMDRGIGVPVALREAIFERSTRTEEGRRRAQGSGLGLYICRRLAELHGGTVFLERSSEQGSTFTVLLPREFAPAAPEPLPPRS